MRSLRCKALKLWCGVVLAAMAGLLAAPAALEAQSGPSPLGVQSTQPSPPSAFAPQAAPQARGAGGGFFAWVMETQQNLQRQLADAVRKLKSEHVLGAALGLALLSFLYGVVHAVGPGHGKAIISSYVVANEETVRRGVLISFLAAGVQALSAIALVGVLAIALNATGLAMTAWSHRLESASYALIALVGAWLLASQLAKLWRRHGQRLRIHASGASEPKTHHHQAHHHHGHAHDHAHDHGGGDSACGHVPDAKSLAGPFSWRKIAAVVLSVGIRPCTGAIVVLVFALAQGLFWAGVAATFAMALGTAITVAALATLALGSRELALRLGRGNSAWTDTVWSICAIGGASLILLLGLTLFIGSLGPARPF